MKNGRNMDGTFSAGNSGRPKGARNHKTVASESLLEGQAEALTQTAISERTKGRYCSPAPIRPADKPRAS